MMVKNIFTQRCSIVVCPHCRKVKKFGKWLELTAEQSQRLSERFSGFDILEESCPKCEVCYEVV